MKNLLGYLNQSEWIYSLNIGNIMQISPLTLQDFMSASSLQIELSREFVLEKVSLALVKLKISYASWLFHISAWGPNTGFFTSCRKCLESIFTREEIRKLSSKFINIVSTGMGKLSKLPFHFCPVRVRWCHIS